MDHRDKQQESMIIAGFGGQGVIFSGKLLAQTAMRAHKEVTLIPAYGAEVRGGTSNCTVIIDEAPIASPIVASPTALIIMNKASLAKFAHRLRPGGILIYNSSLIDAPPDLPETDTVVPIPADELAIELGNQKVANMIMLGAYARLCRVMELTDVTDALPEVLAARYHSTLDTNAAALKKGADFVICHH
ncbi:MAG: 2-oxoacid:ferredoxin oxidoreductase subunit gamma [Planctomycetes bacterium]|nr:2-oxoacid:ferredoxin oxidoreductase subunit gamma [Planctomycetota bacterium]